MQRFDADLIGPERVEPLSMSQRAAWYLRRQRHNVNRTATTTIKVWRS